jgi:enediyne polyketide synthase
MGFGGINAHIVLAADRTETALRLSAGERALSSSFQDAELFLFAGRNDDDLQQQISHVSRFAAKLSLSELSDLAAHLATSVTHQAVRAAVVASRPSDLAARLEQLNTLIKNENSGLNPRVDIFWAREPVGSRVGFLFPGQGTPIHRSGGAWCRRFDFVRDLYARAQLDNHENETSTLTAQPAIVTASLAALHLLKTLNINAEIAVGHSLGELTAFHWAEAIDEETLLRIAKFRGRAMSERGAPSGAMASISASAEESLNLLNGEGVCIAGINSPTQTIISGEAKAVIEVMLRAQQKNLQTFRLPVSHAFHSKLVAAAAPALQTQLEVEKFGSLRRTIVSTVTGECISPNANLRGLLTQQITSPVRFLEAVTDASKEIDLWLEVGPGQVLAGIMSEITKTPVVSLEAGGESLRGLLSATAAAFVLGQPVNYRALFDGRFTRPFSLDWNPKFFVNPCELAPIPQESERSTVIEAEEISVEIETNSEAETISGSPNGSVLELVSELVAQRVELPVSAINAESHVLNDLHLNSISVSQLVAESARRLQLPRPSSPSDFATATIGEIAHALEEQLSLGGRSLSEEPDSLPTGVDSWVRQFRVELVERPLRPQPAAREVGVWHVLSRTESPLVKTLRREFAGSPGNGVVVCLPNEADETIIGDLLAAARLVLPKKEGTTFLLVQQLHGASAFARTLHLEAPHVTTCIVNVPPAHPQAAGWVLAEAMAAEQHTEVYYDENGRRRQPFLRSLSLFEESASLPLSADDVLLVTGGGKGITAECALALAKESGARLALIGRSHANSDDELSNNLKRMTAAGIGFRYVAADVTDAAQISAAVEEIEKELGPVTGFLHGAATNTPRIISALDEALMRQTVDVKVQGARNVLAVINPEKLRLFVTFSSIIARSGLPGEAHYGLANEWLSALTEDWQTEHPSCRCLALEWSLWSDVGMGQRIQRSDLLAQHGITPISPDQGIKTLLQLLAQPLLNGPCVVTGRFREMPTLKLERPELPLQRFLEQPQLYFPNVELIVDVDLATSTDPYLDDHQLNGERLLPAVIGLEAMAQVAMALTIVTELPVFENVKFNSPIVVPEAGQRRIRLAALVTAPGVVKVAVRSDETAFQLDHFVGTCRFGKPNLCEVMLQSQLPAKDSASAIALKPEHDLYGDVLFHRGRFQRLSNYRILKSRECFAEIAADGKTNWFGSYLPKDLVLGDPGVHDAAMHAIQACIPAATLLPTGVERLSLRGTALSGPSFVRARERSNDGNIFVYDVSVADAAGHIVERWDGLSLTAIEAKRNGRSWIEPILAPYLERRFRELVPGTDISVAVIHDEGGDHLARSNKAIRMLVDAESEIFRRSDGKPEVAAECSVSAAHCGGVTMAVAGFGPVGCDVESAVNRPSCVWRTLLGDERIALVQFVEQRANENPCASAARIWAAGECLKKAGAMPRAPLTFLGAHSDGWVVFSSGLFNIATFAAQIRGEAAKVVVAILAQRQ